MKVATGLNNILGAFNVLSALREGQMQFKLWLEPLYRLRLGHGQVVKNEQRAGHMVCAVGARNSSTKRQQTLNPVKTSLILSLLAGSVFCLGCGSKRKNVETPPAPARRLEISYYRLRAYDVDQIRKFSQARMNSGNRLLDKDPAAITDALFFFQDAGRIVLARPDFDNIRSMLFLDIRKRLADYDAVEEIIGRLVDEGIWGLRTPETNRVEKLTYAYLLLNIMAELKPELKKNEAFYNMVVRIRDANLKLNEEVNDAAEVKAMISVNSPSEVAKRILKEITVSK